MTISEERKNGVGDIRNEYMRIKRRVNREIRNRVSRGISRIQALTELAQEITDGNYNAISGPPRPDSSEVRVPSMVVVSQALTDLNAARRREWTTTVPISTSRTFSATSSANLGNAVRNLEPELSAPRPPNLRIATTENLASSRTRLINRIRNMRRLINSRSRNANQQQRTQIPQRNANVPERTPPPRRAANVPERTPPPRRIVYVREGTPPPRSSVNIWERSPSPGRSVDDPEIRSPVRDEIIPLYQYNPETFNPVRLTLKQAINVISFFNVYNNREYELIKTTLFNFSIKIVGLENCVRQDFGLAVYLFIEQHFNLQPRMELCVQPVRDRHENDNVVGVLFERCTDANLILERRHVLNNTQYRVYRNDRLAWILFNYRCANSRSRT